MYSAWLYNRRGRNLGGYRFNLGSILTANVRLFTVSINTALAFLSHAVLKSRFSNIAERARSMQCERHPYHYSLQSVRFSWLICLKSQG